MADRPVLGSDVLIDYLRGAGPGLELVDALRRSVDYLVTAISALQSEGRGIEIRDAIQAGMCLDADRPLVTRNLRHHERISGLQAVHPDDWPR